MDVLSLPKKLGALQYKALVLPYRLARPTFLADESVVRLGYERALGALDAKAGALFGDEALVTRGAALRKRADVIETAVELEAKAAKHAAEAEATREQGRDQVARTREAAAEKADAAVREARQDEQAEKQRVARETAQREQAEKARIEKAAKAKASAAEKALKADRERIATAEKAVTAAPKAQLDGAVGTLTDAQQQRSDADVLAALQAREKATREAERAARR